MSISTFNQQLLDYLSLSPTPFHAVETMKHQLCEAGFRVLNEREAWSLEQGGCYLVTRNDSALIAFVMPGNEQMIDQGFRMVGAHTDSPCLKVKPNPELNRDGYFQLGVEVYGGALLNPWFDRDLSLAGRVNYVDDSGELAQGLIDYQDPIAVIPSLAIHLDREANESRSINAQKHLPVILFQSENQQTDFRTLLLDQLKRQGIEAAKVLDYELLFYDTQAPAMIGLNQDFLASARLDNLLSCFVGLKSLLDSDRSRGAILVCNDHEEVGSVSAAGADGPFLQSIIERIAPDVELRNRMLASSMMISADNAHGIHPNYADKHDSNHGPKLNAGPVIKINANQRYATNSETSAVFRFLAEQEEVQVQAFTVRSDMGCGSTIGPMTAAKIGVPTLDVGVPTFAMHSVRELAGRDDSESLYRVLKRFYSDQA
ncbi:M18 family aminopeptidase [Motiliproteus sp. MSK22-1]|uniref:M18 family aminopeptidase n=1 Tax=Motiliproteus sp. MSK22-1 TaxID=1897630 RepID=UPI000977D177|nr:M18 family aminopeptidase [Motiliproteus sp. MSK22-1]OMH36238.1 M18 family aminopeptidase [Motiliproteus sp. MSK22-1]